MLAQRPAVTLIPTTDGFTVTSERGELGYIVGQPHDKDVDAHAYLPAKDGWARELVSTFADIGQAVAFITENGVAF